MCWTDLSLVKPDPLRQVLGEVDDPELQGRLMSLCIALVEADLHLAESDSVCWLPPCRNGGWCGSRHHRCQANPKTGACDPLGSVPLEAGSKY